MRQLLLLSGGRAGSTAAAGNLPAACGRQCHRLEKPRRTKSTAGAAPLSEADEKLLNALYAQRKRLAGKQNVPAFMVFSDATLREMVEKKPLSLDELLNISGVGEKKAPATAPPSCASSKMRWKTGNEPPRSPSDKRKKAPPRGAFRAPCRAAHPGRGRVFFSSVRSRRSRRIHHKGAAGGQGAVDELFGGGVLHGCG